MTNPYRPPNQPVDQAAANEPASPTSQQPRSDQVDLRSGMHALFAAISIVVLIVSTVFLVARWVIDVSLD